MQLKSYFHLAYLWMIWVMPGCAFKIELYECIHLFMSVKCIPIVCTCLCRGRHRDVTFWHASGRQGFQCFSFLESLELP